MSELEKILSLNDLEKIISSLKEDGKKIVLCHGTFDLMHVGHIKHIQYAKKLGDVLVVTITADEFVNKGPGRPVFNQSLRSENIAALGCVDYVAINHEVTSVNVIEQLKPDVYVKGSEYKKTEDDVTGNIDAEKNTVEKYGGHIEFTDEPTFSSSKLLNEYFDVFSSSTKVFLDNIKQFYDSKSIHQEIDRLKKLKVAVIGDAILDEYHYVTVLGQTGKGNIPAVRYNSEERFAGGSLAVVNHIAGFVEQVSLITAIGDNQKEESFIRDRLKENVDPVLFYFKNAPTITKRRYVDDEMNKFFEVYLADSQPMDEELEARMINWIQDNFSKYDLIVVPDFGNGLITQNMVNTISEHARFLAVNTQINSGNRGYHVINRYPRADFISLNEPEIRMAAHDEHSPILDVAANVSKKLSAKYTAVTRGVKGVLLLDPKQDSSFEVPAISTKVVDRIGAGDAFLSLSSLCLANGSDIKIAALIGSIAAALDVQIVCNRESVDPVAVKKYATTLLK